MRKRLPGSNAGLPTAIGLDAGNRAKDGPVQIRDGERYFNNSRYIAYHPTVQIGAPYESSDAPRAIKRKRRISFPYVTSRGSGRENPQGRGTFRTKLLKGPHMFSAPTQMHNDPFLACGNISACCTTFH